ncbi:MAG: cytochrome c biogenesis protein CcsA, partial [Pseudomonadota bacterium]|nr:cytochrome c biogenesis protein CcsA [Pseudomonadota bacterium]
VETLAIMVLPVAAVTLALDQFMPNQPVIAAPAGSSLQIHILISLVAYSLLSIAALQALVLAVQDWQLHNHRPGGLIRALPPLQWMEDLLFQLIAVGFALLSVSLLTGFFFLEDIFAQHLVHKTVLSIVAWLVFAVLLFGRMRFGWRGRTAIKWTLSGILALMLAYFGSKLVLELILQRP